jgi:hypothetical protein
VRFSAVLSTFDAATDGADDDPGVPGAMLTKPTACPVAMLGGIGCAMYAALVVCCPSGPAKLMRSPFMNTSIVAGEFGPEM